MNNQLLSEREAEQAYAHQQEIEQAACWCKQNYPHKFNFLNEIHDLLIAEERHLRKFGLFSKTSKLLPVLSILTPSQALRLLESFKRAVLDLPEAWHAKRLSDITAIERARAHKTLITELKQAMKDNHVRTL
jgi:hypothetical protein